MRADRITDILRQPQLACKLTLPEWAVLIRILRREQLLARFAHNFSPLAQQLDNKIKEYVQFHLSNAIAIADRQSKSVKFEVFELTRQLGDLFKDNVILLKGAAYSVSNNQASIGRTYGDIDLLTSKDNISKIENSLNLFGWLGKEVNDYDEKYYREWCHEIPPLAHASRGTVIDLHHNLVPIVSGRAPDIESFVQGASVVTGIKVLRPAAMTLHSIVHLFLNEDFDYGLRNINDISLLFSEFDCGEFWRDIYSLAQNEKFTLELYLAMYFSEKMFNVNVCSKTMQKLKKQHSSPVSNLYHSFVFKHALSAKHELATNPISKFANVLAYVRGHWLKMPINVLIPHLISKAWFSFVESLFGKSYFVEKD